MATPYSIIARCSGGTPSSYLKLEPGGGESGTSEGVRVTVGLCIGGEIVVTVGTVGVKVGAADGILVAIGGSWFG